jgi:hypothetical protein
MPSRFGHRAIQISLALSSLLTKLAARVAAWIDDVTLASRLCWLDEVAS